MGPDVRPTIKNENLFFVALFFNMLITVMNTTMFNVAIPSISSQFNLTATLASWVVTSYSVVFAIGTVMYGRLTGIYPIKNLFTIGLILLGIGSIMGVLVESYYLLIVARLIQAAGTSSISALGMIAITRYIPENRKGAAMGKVAAASTLGFGLGPLVGGLLTEYLGWRFLFVVSLISVLMIPVYRMNVPEDKRPKEHFDIVGLLYLCIGAVALLLFITTENIIFLLGIGFLFIFWRHIRNVKNPFIAPSLLTSKKYLAIITIGFLMFFINFSILFISPLLLADLHEASVAQIGFIIFPGAICSALLSILIGKLLDNIGVLPIIGGGILIMFFAVFLFSSYSYISEWTILFFYLLSSLSFACITMGLPNFLSDLLKPKQFPSGFGILQLLQFFGGATGVSVSGKILDMGTRETHHINVIWKSNNFVYSNAYFLLIILTVVAGGTFYFLKKQKRNSKLFFMKSLS
jgi:MFS transporter, DHA2 family, metal-tetracycline-proton antiporter